MLAVFQDWAGCWRGSADRSIVYKPENPDKRFRTQVAIQSFEFC